MTPYALSRYPISRASRLSCSLCRPPEAHLGSELDLLPGVGIAGAEKAREHVLPFLGGNARPDRVHEGVAEHRSKIVVFQDPTLNFLGQLLALGGLDRGDILVELGVEFGDAELIGAKAAAALEQRLIPIGPARADSRAAKDDLDPGPFLHP